MKDWQVELGSRWESVREKGRTLGWHNRPSPCVADLAALVGLDWYSSRRSDEVADFIIHDARTLLNGVPSFGRIKCQRLIEILEAASSDAVSCGEVTFEEVLASWAVPGDFPLALIPISTRLRNLCEQQQITTLATLLAFWKSLGRTGLLAHENVGRKTVDELEALTRAVTSSSADAVRDWLPLNDSATGLCIRRAMALHINSVPEQTREILTLRLVDKFTLEESAVGHHITRERVRQYEASYLGGIRAILEWFVQERTAMLDAWMEDREWQSYVIPQCSDAVTLLLLAGIEACFAETPQGIARRLAEESDLEMWVNQLKRHPDLHLGGVDLGEFLESHVPKAKHLDLVARLSGISTLRIDHAQGVVKPSEPCVRDTVCAILAEEDEAIPLTWLAHRVQSVEGCGDGDADFIMRNRYRWSAMGFLDLAKVIWNQ